MKAAVMEELKKPLVVRQIDDPSVDAKEASFGLKRTGFAVLTGMRGWVTKPGSVNHSKCRRSWVMNLLALLKRLERI
ncbi:hypothetical protein [Salicibibacter cibi]|uniref:hypothetical protein n=1 Tax=Salicibibacter cibi TaxID=2743001 RepID=UPI0031B5BC73